MTSVEDCVELAIRGLDVCVHGSEERLIQATRGNNIDGLEAVSVFKRSKNEKGLASEWRFEKRDRKSYSGSSES